ncbi:hypothetical protein, partial [Roseburia inulinivorans]|uniref:hypothetical protein n=1 Tax=Roseburia inulinivorans TaxID=360807 RepID=UPI00241C131F
VFLLWGIAKTIYNVLGGFYGYYSIMIVWISVHKVHKNRMLFLCNFTSVIFRNLQDKENPAQKIVSFRAGFCFSIIYC